MNIPMPPRTEHVWHDLVWFPRDYEPDQLVIDRDELSAEPLLQWEGPDVEGREQQNEPWRQLAGVVPHAEILHRFTDTRWVPFEGKPLPDGSNIGPIIAEDGTRKINGSPELYSTFVLYRRWLTFLHLEALLSVHVSRHPDSGHLIVDIINERLIKDVLTQSLPRDAMLIAEDERARVKPLDELFKQYEPDMGLNWIFYWRKSVVNQLYTMMAAASWAVDTAGDEEEHAMLEEFKNFSLQHQVLVAIVYKEALFERRLRVLHVEEEHILKRVRLVGTRYLGFLGRENLDDIEERYLQTVFKATRDFQELLRSLFSFRQLRDWGYGRTWHKMHLVFDTELRPDFKDPVNRVRRQVTATRRSKDLFGVLPVEKSSLEANCMICLEDWLDHDLATETRCHHFFHARCIVRYWDQEFHYDFRCPLCRASPGRLRDRVSFVAEREDFGSDPADVAAHTFAMGEVNAHAAANPNVRPVDFPPEYQLALGRHRERIMLQGSFAFEEDEIYYPLP